MEQVHGLVARERRVGSVRCERRNDALHGMKHRPEPCRDEALVCEQRCQLVGEHEDGEKLQVGGSGRWRLPRRTRRRRRQHGAKVGVSGVGRQHNDRSCAPDRAAERLAHVRRQESGDVVERHHGCADRRAGIIVRGRGEVDARGRERAPDLAGLLGRHMGNVLDDLLAGEANELREDGVEEKRADGLRKQVAKRVALRITGVELLLAPGDERVDHDRQQHLGELRCERDRIVGVKSLVGTEFLQRRMQVCLGLTGDARKHALQVEADVGDDAPPCAVAPAKAVVEIGRDARAGVVRREQLDRGDKLRNEHGGERCARPDCRPDFYLVEHDADVSLGLRR